jgi:hypothetical protein
MPSDRLKEAMKRAAYSHEKINKGAGETTGKADEEPKPPARVPFRRHPVEAPPESRVRPGSQRPRRERKTTAREVNRNRTDEDEVIEDDGQGEARPPRPVRSNLPPDPFPLQYRDGDPDKEWECD